MSRCARAWLLCLSTAALPACGPTPEPAGLPAARLDPESAVRSTGRSRQPPGQSTSGASSFEERLRRRQGESPASGPDSAPQTLPRQAIALGNGLIAELPQRFDAWSWSREGELVLAAHERNGQTDALIYTQAQPGDRPAAAMNRFLGHVDPELGSEWLLTLSETGRLAARAAANLPLSPREAARGLTSLAAPTLGRGFGYRSEPNSFTGWRWMGENEHGVYLRLGRTEGSWGAQGELPEEVRVLAESLAGEMPQLQEMLGPRGTAPSLPDTPAFLLIGSATRRGRTIGLAVLCRRTPSCAVEDDLIGLLTSLRLGDDLAAAPQGRGQLADVARQAGLQLAPTASLVTPSTVAAALESADRAGRGEAP